MLMQRLSKHRAHGVGRPITAPSRVHRLRGRDSRTLYADESDDHRR